jgi:hypothetical protein
VPSPASLNAQILRNAINNQYVYLFHNWRDKSTEGCVARLHAGLHGGEATHAYHDHRHAVRHLGAWTRPGARSSARSALRRGAVVIEEVQAGAADSRRFSA